MRRGKIPLKLWMNKDEDQPASGMTEVEVGEMFGYSQNAINKMLRGGRNIDVVHLSYDPNRGHVYQLVETKVLSTGVHPYLE